MLWNVNIGFVLFFKCKIDWIFTCNCNFKIYMLLQSIDFRNSECDEVTEVLGRWAVELCTCGFESHSHLICFDYKFSKHIFSCWACPMAVLGPSIVRVCLISSFLILSGLQNRSVSQYASALLSFVNYCSNCIANSWKTLMQHISFPKIPVIISDKTNSFLILKARPFREKAMHQKKRIISS